MKVKLTVAEVVEREVKRLRELGGDKAIRISPKAASARSVCAKVSEFKKVREDFKDVRVTVVKDAAFLYLGAK